MASAQTNRSRVVFLLVLASSSASLWIGGCAQEKAVSSEQSPRTPTAPASPPSTLAEPNATLDASAQMLDAAATLEPPGDRSSDAGSDEHVILWSWKGTYVFAECGDRKCPTYRIVVEKCPGPCKVHIDADGPNTKLRLEGVGHGTSNRYQLEVRFTNDRASAKSDASSTTTTFSPNAVLLTLERLPGDHTMLLFGKLESPNKIPSLMIRSPQ